MKSGTFYSFPKPRHVISQLSQTDDWGSSLIGRSARFKGAGVKVGILDSGCSLAHPDLKEAIFTFRDLSGGGKEYGGGHGTHVAGIVGARDNDIGVIGVAPESELGIYKVLADNGWGEYDWFTRAVYAAIDDGCNILNLSLGSNQQPPDSVRDAIRSAAEAGIMIFAAAGNDGQGVGNSGDAVDFPARWEEVIAVASVEKNKQHSVFSAPGPSVEVCAPGRDIYSCWPPDGYCLLTGTSMATPFAAGVGAVYWSMVLSTEPECPNIKARVTELMLNDVCDLGDKGRDGVYGHGVVCVKC